MKFLEKSLEESNNINKVLDLFSNRVQNVNLDDNLIKIVREKTLYRITISLNDLELGNVDIQPILNRKGSYFGENSRVQAEVKNLYVVEEFRNQHLGSKLMKIATDVFGDLNLYIYPNPNRIKDLNENNVEDYRSSLIKLYNRYGFNKIDDSGFGMKRLPDETLK